MKYINATTAYKTDDRFKEWQNTQSIKLATANVHAGLLNRIQSHSLLLDVNMGVEVSAVIIPNAYDRILSQASGYYDIHRYTLTCFIRYLMEENAC